MRGNREFKLRRQKNEVGNAVSIVNICFSIGLRLKKPKHKGGVSVIFSIFGIWIWIWRAEQSQNLTRRLANSVLLSCAAGVLVWQNNNVKKYI